MALSQQIISILTDVLGLQNRPPLQPDTALLGSLPELDSMAVVNVITALEEQFGIAVDDDEISADTFESVATLTAYVARKQEE